MRMFRKLMVLSVISLAAISAVAQAESTDQKSSTKNQEPVLLQGAKAASVPPALQKNSAKLYAAVPTSAPALAPVAPSVPPSAEQLAGDAYAAAPNQVPATRGLRTEAGDRYTCPRGYRCTNIGGPALPESGIVCVKEMIIWQTRECGACVYRAAVAPSRQGSLQTSHEVCA